MVSEPLPNRREPIELTSADVEAAIDRIGARDAKLAREASDVFESLTWGQGPQALRQAGLQDWLWYVVPTKYLTDEVGYMVRLAEAAAVLFDELGLHRYAAICRGEITRMVHRTFDESEAAGRAAMRQATRASGIDAVDLEDFAWGAVMGMAESTARSAVEDALEAAVVSGRLVVGSRGWHQRQAEITAETLDKDHPVEPGQSWRTSVITERIQHWIDSAERRSPENAALRRRTANRLLHPIDPPPEVASMMKPLTWLLSEFGAQQPLTKAGYLSPAVVRRFHAEAPWDDPYGFRPPPRTELDEPFLHQFRGWLVGAGALRKHNTTLRRTPAGAAAAADPVQAWTLFVANLGAPGWSRFVMETCGLVMLTRQCDVADRELFAEVAAMAAGLGWATSPTSQNRSPSEHDVSAAFYPMLTLLKICGVVTEAGGWLNGRLGLTPAGMTTMSAAIRLTAAGPQSLPW